MKRRIMVLLVCAVAVLGGVAVTSCDKVGEILSNLGLSDEDIVKGLRTALDSSANTSALNASKVNGFLMNELIKIAAPPEVVQLKEALDGVAANPAAKVAFMALTEQSPEEFLGDKMENLVKSINHAAEEGSKKAYPIFKKAITDMTITDGLRILQGGDTAATDYLKKKTYRALVEAFAEPVREVVDNGEVSSLWKPVAEKYNLIAPAMIKGMSVPGYTFVGPESVNPDLSEYITEQAMTGLFKLVAEEEAAIRKNPKKYASDIIRKVFGSPEAKKALNK